jgi:hypothetical protein
MRVLIRISDVRLAGDALSKGQANGGTGKLIEGVKRGVQSLRDFVRRSCFCAAAASSLIACTFVGDTLEVGPFLREQITGDSWNACLAREYQSQARLQVRTGRQWQTATMLAAKGRQALAGLPVAPEPAPPALDASAKQLTQSLTYKTQSPCECAKVQGLFDGWVTAVLQDTDTDQAPLRTAFAQAVDACTKPR